MIGVARSGTRVGEAPLRFTFDSREYSALDGDTAASALLASGVRLFGRSVKYRRPRGVIAAGPDEPNALLTWDRGGAPVPNLPASMLRLGEAVCLRSQNRWPSLQHDLTAAIGILGGGMLGAGFYYKTFMWPSWKTYEWLIRRLAGLGPAPDRCTLGAPNVEHLDCDIVVAGAGPAGLSAALAAAAAGARVIVCEREPHCGGELEFEDAVVDGRAARAWVAAAVEQLLRRGARVLTDVAVVGGSRQLVIAHGDVSPVAPQARSYRIRAAAVVNAMGAVERPIAFANNDLPGVMLVGAAERYAARYGVRVGQRVVLFGCHQRLYAAARRLLAAGTRIVAVVDTRSDADAPADLVAAGVECLRGHTVLEAHGRLAIRGVRIAPIAVPTASRDLECDALLVSGGWTPAVHLGLQDGGRTSYAADLAAFVAVPMEQTIACGAADGVVELGAVVADGSRVGELAAQRALGAEACGPAILPSAGQPDTRGDPAPALVPFWRAPARRADEKRQFVDFQNDVTVADLRQAVAEGFVHIEHAKRYTTLGVGTEQGRTGGLLGAAILAEFAGSKLQHVGVSRTRPPYQPVTLETLTGHRRGLALRPARRTPMHDWHTAHGGVLEPMGLWMRPRYYGCNGADAASAGTVEAARVRQFGGIVDGSTLGKIEIVGADAGAFLDRMYLTRASTMRVGRSKYMVLLREDGMVLDDGIVLRLAPDRFLATTSSSHAEHVLSHLEFWQELEFSAADVCLTDVTEAWSVVVVAGPRSRESLRTVLGPSWHEPLERLAHMEFASGAWQDAALRLLRASFSGERAYELHCRPRVALRLWAELVATGLEPYGTEALDVLRLEKGYLVSSELNGQTSPHDIGLDAMVKQGNPCIGSELLQRPGLHEASRERLVGLQTVDGAASLAAGAQLTLSADSRDACGHVTSAAFSPALGRSIALALVARFVPEGSELVARDPLRGREARVRVVAPVQYDPSGERMKS